MKIRTKLSLLFAIIFASILILSSVSIYISSQTFREEQFFSRLKDRALTTAKLLIEVKEVDKDLLKIIDKHTLLLPKEEISIYNYLNEQIYSSVEKDSTFIPVNILNQVRVNNEIKFEDGENEAIGILFTDENNRFVIIASAFDKYGLGKLKYLRLILAINFLISILIVVLVGWFYAGQALKPMSNVIRQVDEIKGTSLNLRVITENPKDEIAQLANTFNKMLERIEEAFTIQKMFVSNASHELRTPLTSITGQIEVTLMNKRDQKEYEKVLLSILEDIKNLNILSDGLLSLAQATLDVNESTFSNIRIDEVLWSAISELQKHKPEYKIDVEFGEIPSEEEKLIIYGSETLVKTALINIIDNACKYSNDKISRILINIIGKKILIKISDNGIGISHEDLDKIFEPFFRAKNARKQKGHGLGLALSKKIIELHSGLIEIDSTINKGTSIIITFNNIF